MPEDLNLEPEPWGSRPIEQRRGRRGVERKERQRGIAAWPHSHSRRSRSQSSGAVVQLAVA